MTMEDHDLLVARECTDIQGGQYGSASIVFGYQKATKKRLYIMRSDDHVMKFHLSSRASTHVRREAISRVQSSLMQLNPDGALDLVCVLRASNPHGIYGKTSSLVH